MVNSLKINSLANYGGQLVAGILGYAMVPFYLRHLGTEGYGMVGFLLVLQSSLAVLDLGLGTSATREISRLSAEPSAAGEMRHLLRTLEVFYYGMAAVIVTALLLAKTWVVARWLKANELSPQTLDTCLWCAVGTVGLRWPVALYSGVLRGRERQLLLNGISSGIAIVKALAGGAVILLISPRVESFYFVQLAMAVLELGLMSGAAWWAVRGPSPSPAQFHRRLLKQVWGFSARLALISGFAMLLKQVDRWAIAALLPIEQLGFYTNAALLGMGISRVFNPLQNAVFPRLTRLVAADPGQLLPATFHRSCQCVMALVAPVAAIMVAGGGPVLQLWLRSGDPDGRAAAAGTAPLAVTAVAMLFNSAMAIPYSLQLAAGMTWLPMWTNGLGALVLVPISFVAVRQWGLAGAAYAWLVFNVLYYLVVPHFIFARVLRGHKAAWYLRDTGPFIVLGLLLSWILHELRLRLPQPAAQAGALALALAAYGGLVWAFVPELRQLVVRLTAKASRRNATAN